MSPQFTDDDTGKTVVNAAGDEVGIVAAVEHGTAHVEPDPGITDTIKAKLGWGGTDTDAYPLQEESVATVTDDAVHLESDLEGGAASGGRTDTQVGSDESAGEQAGTTHDETAGTAAEPDVETTGSASADATEATEDRSVDDDDDLMGDDDELLGDDEGITDDDDAGIRSDDDDGLLDDDDDGVLGDTDDDDEGIRNDDEDELLGDDDDEDLT